MKLKDAKCECGNAKWGRRDNGPWECKVCEIPANDEISILLDDVVLYHIKKGGLNDF